ncbi:uncharacterized protein [Bemisia tabaci]
MCTVNAHPLDTINCLLRFFGPIQRSLKCQIVNTSRIREEIQKKAESLREEVKAELKGAFVSVKINFASRNTTKHYLTTNVQFSKDGCIQTRLLRIVPVAISSTGEDLKKKVLEVLTEYDIPLKLIFSSSISNGGNIWEYPFLVDSNANCPNQGVTNLSDCLTTEVEEQVDAFASYRSRKISLKMERDTQEGAECSNKAKGCARSEENSDASQNEFEFADDENLNKLLSATDKALQEEGICSIHSAARVLQLGIQDTLKSSRYKAVILKAKKLVKSLQTFEMAKLFAEKNQKRPVLCNDSWDSIYRILIQLIELMPFIQENIPSACGQLSLQDQCDMKEIIVSLKPCATASMKLLLEPLPYSEVFTIFTVCIAKIEMLTTNGASQFASLLSNKIRTRTEQVFSPDLFAAVILDKRFKTVLDGTQVRMGTHRLLEIWERIVGTDQNHTPDLQPMVEAPMEMDSEDDEMKDLSILRDIMERNKSNECCFKFPTSLMLELIRAKIETYLRENNLEASENVFKYWHDSQFTNPELASLAKILLAVPGDELLLQRLISSLQMIYSEPSNKPDFQLLNDILFIRMNFPRCFGEVE